MGEFMFLPFSPVYSSGERNSSKHRTHCEVSARRPVCPAPKHARWADVVRLPGQRDGAALRQRRLRRLRTHHRWTSLSRRGITSTVTAWTSLSLSFSLSLSSLPLSPSHSLIFSSQSVWNSLQTNKNTPWEAHKRPHNHNSSQRRLLGLRQTAHTTEHYNKMI